MKYLITLILSLVFINSFAQKRFDFFDNISENMYNGYKIYFDSDTLKSASKAVLTIKHKSATKSIDLLSNNESIEDFDVKTIFFDEQLDIIKNYNTTPDTEFNKKEIKLKNGDTLNLILDLNGKLIKKSLTYGDKGESIGQAQDNNSQGEDTNSEKFNKTSQTIREFAIGENVLSDAKLLIKNSTKKDVKENILKGYGTNYTNVFLKNNIGLSSGDENTGSRFSQNIAKTDVTNFATGMARFLADRAKQELNESFFIQMHKQMEKVPELQFYFPESYIFLKRLDAHSVSFDLNHMRSRFNQDVHNLPINLYTSLNQSNISNKYPQLGHLKNYLDNDPNGILINYALGTVLESQGKINPKDLLYDFAQGEKRSEVEKILLLNILGRNVNRDSLENKGLTILYDSIYNKKINVDPTHENILNVLNTIKLAELVSNSLLSADPDRYWVSDEEIKELFTNDALFQTYIGLVLAKANFNEYNIRFGGRNVKELIEEKFAPGNIVSLDRLTELKQIVRNMYYSYKEVDNVVSQLKAMDKTQAVDESYKLFNVFKNNLVVINNQLLPVISSKNDYVASADIIHNYIAPAVDISYNMYAKKYSVAIKEFVVLLQNTSTYLKENPFLNAINSANLNNLNDATQTYYIGLLKQESVQKHLIENKVFNSQELNEICNKEKIEKEDFIKLIQDKKLEKTFENYFKTQSKDYNKFISKFSTYGVLIANVATAQNSDDVKAAIEASVLPVGSSRIKRHSDWSITANAFVGGFYGKAFYKEQIDGITEKRSIDTFGITAPIGVSFNKGNLALFNSRSVLGINLQLIDLGSLVNFYMQEGDGASLPRDTKIQLGDIIAPGGSISYSIGDTPFTLMGGVQYVPTLSRMETISTNNEFKPLTWRVHIGLVIDIPLFNLKVWN